MVGGSAGGDNTGWCDGGRGGTGGTGGRGGDGGNGGAGANGLNETIRQVGSSISVSGGSIPSDGVITANWFSGCRNSAITLSKTTGNAWSLGSGATLVTDRTSTTSSFSTSSNTIDIYYPSSTTIGAKDISTTGATISNFIEVKGDRLIAPSSAVITSSSSPCPLESVSLTNTLTSVQAANVVAYDWSISVASNPTVNIFTSTAANPGIVNPPIGGWQPFTLYQIKLRLQESCCGWSIPMYSGFVVLGVPPSNSAAISGSDNIVCANQSGVTYSIPAVSTATGYIWTVTGGLINDNSNTTFNTTNTSITVNWGGSGTGTVSVLPYNNCGTAVSATTLNVTVNTNPVAHISASPSATVCNGTSVFLLATATSGTGGNSIFTYRWSTNSTNSTIGPISSSTTQSVTLTEGLSGCSASASQAVIVNPLPTITASSTAAQSCKNPTATNSSLSYSATTNSPTSYMITWDGAAFSAGLVDVDPTPLPVSPIPVPIYANVAAGTYTGTLTVFNNNGCNNLGIQFTVTVVDNVPPTSLAGTLDGTGCSSFTAHWNLVSTASGYVVETSTNNFSSILASYTIGPVNSFSIPGNPGTTYQYRIRSIACGSPSLAASAIQTVVMSPATPAVNSTSAATAIGCTSFRASWTSSVNADRYFVYVYSDAGLTTPISGWNGTQISGISTVISGLTPGTNYYYNVKAANDCGTAGFSSATTVHTSDPTVTPVATAASALDCHQFRANWNSANFATKYYIDVSTSPTFDPAYFVTGWNNKLVNNVTSSLVTVSGGLTMGATYYYRVELRMLVIQVPVQIQLALRSLIYRYWYLARVM